MATTTVQRDVYNPLLFEIAWEVANKGKVLCVRAREIAETKRLRE